MSYKTLQILSLLSFLRRLNILPTIVTFHLPSVNTVCSCGQWLVRLQYMWGYTRSNTSFPRPGRSENVWRFKCMWLYTYFSFSSRIPFYFKACSQWLFFFLLNLHPNNPGRLLVSVPEWDSFLAVLETLSWNRCICSRFHVLTVQLKTDLEMEKRCKTPFQHCCSGNIFLSFVTWLFRDCLKPHLQSLKERAN